jgi:Zn-dependent M28 family amino/carboxypeptidase
MPDQSYVEQKHRSLSKLLILLGVILVPIFVVYWFVSVPGQSYAGRPPAPTAHSETLQNALAKHISAVANKPHNVENYYELLRVAEYIERELDQLNLKSSSQYFTVSDLPIRNIEVVIPSTDKDAKTLVVGAHYDSAGAAPGANDNGSGTAALLELARSLQSMQQPSKINIRLVFFVNEEPPYFQTAEMGSMVYAKMLHENGVKVAGMLSLETIGYYDDSPNSQNYPFPLSLAYPDRGNFIAFVGMTSSRSFLHHTVRSFREDAKVPSIGGVAPDFISGIGWSDHWSFAQYDTAPFRYPYYHTKQDTPDKIDLPHLSLVVIGLEAMLKKWMQKGME